MDRFDLENSITSCWGTKDDIELLADSISNKNMTEDEVLNSLLGISQLHEMRCQKLFNIFEELIKNKLIINKEDDFSEMQQY